jgi:chromosome segregation protein
MKLRRLTLYGFKSFADRTELRFHDGITAIVGPNGCGKSNISDAIRWVLGEQRASAIRGTRMDEAIFQGTAERRAVNRAEVAMGFSNVERRLPVPYDEIEIRRTVYREGGSEYQLNRAPCRLRDIFDLYRDTGLGANAYTVIEQGMVDAILSDRAEERRQLFEEAAGIGRYKERRKVAQRRLEAAELDVARLDDLIGEVETQVRSLARQRRRAQRYTELRTRRLAVEVALAAAELEEADRALAETALRLEALGREQPGAHAALTTAEAELERRRLEAGEAARLRNAAAARFEEATRRIGERERELAVAEERRAHAEQRLAQIERERAELKERRVALDAERAEVQVRATEQRALVAELGARVQGVQARQQALREEVAAGRRDEAAARAQEEELTRALAQLEADAAGAEARAAEEAARSERLGEEEAQLQAELALLGQQGDLFTEQARALATRRATVEAEREACAELLAALQAEEQRARRALAAAEDAVNLLAARVAAIEALEREFHGFAPAVAAALAERNTLEGLVGPVAELLRLPPERAAAVEGTLGSLLQLLVVKDAAAAARLRDWLAAGHGEKGALALLPEDAVARLSALLEALEFAGQPAAEPILLGRRERLKAMRKELKAAERERDERAATRQALARQLAEVEGEVRVLAARVEAAELDVRRGEADEAARTGRHERTQHRLRELARHRAEMVAAAERARADAAAARTARTRIEARLDAHRAGAQQVVGTRVEKEVAWEEVRDEESELRVAHARAEGLLADLERRAAACATGLQQAADRLQLLEREETGHRDALETLATLRAEGGTELEQAFARRDELAAELRALDETHTTAGERADVLEAEARRLRRSSQDTAEERHRLELRRSEAGAAERRIRERLESEWARPFEQLRALAGPVAAEGAEPPDADTLRNELREIVAETERLGPINMLAIEEHDEEARRLEFLTAQRADLNRARDDLQSAIRQINRTAKELFTGTFDRIRVHFADTFATLFEGGECDVRLADPDDPLESEIEIAASPKGKRTQRIHLMSGGERALTALALLFAIYLVKPSPFCVLDEVDAPLDEANIGRFVAMLQRFKVDTQFVVITHNTRTMEAADWIYGVTMEEAGVSSVVGVQLDEVLDDAPAHAPA